MSKNIKYAVLIPAYKPDEKFVDFVTLLRKQNIPVVVVDDGSGEACSDFFVSAEKVGCVVVHHEVNGGKGKALRTGFEEVIRLNSKGAGYNYVVTADCDGQHDIKAITTVVEAAEESLLSEKGPAFIIGGRFRDEGEKIPFKSKLGNGFTRLVFKIATGLSIHDTQTGLRAIPETLFGEMLKIKGDRYEYEMNMLLYTVERGIGIREIPIETIYIDNNSSSHFNVIRDSLKIYAVIFKFVASSLASYLIDFVMLLVLQALLIGVLGEKNALAVATVGARVISSIFNFIFNKKLVFKDEQNLISTLGKYYLVAALILGLKYSALYFLTIIGSMHLVFANMIAELALYALSYTLQRVFVFRKKRK